MSPSAELGWSWLCPGKAPDSASPGAPGVPVDEWLSAPRDALRCAQVLGAGRATTTSRVLGAPVPSAPQPARAGESKPGHPERTLPAPLRPPRIKGPRGFSLQ